MKIALKVARLTIILMTVLMSIFAVRQGDWMLFSVSITATMGWLVAHALEHQVDEMLGLTPPQKFR